MRTFQEIIQTLTTFWEKQGCVIHVGHDVEVGAGTFNPATFLRCLGPEPYNTAYVEPSRRPSDGRYGENPNRVQLFHQFQVIMKPSPENIQQLYLDSLAALGLDLSAHDIRFVHDDWESPTLGAWGLGWEVWCDGMEITQFTYFQAIGNTLLQPITAEIAYGLERLAMFIQNVDSIFAVKWNDSLTFGDISKHAEQEWSAYNFTEASTEMWHRHFADYEKEAASLTAKHLPIPAYDFVLKASHAFNMLEARGVISVTERTGYIARIRDLARIVAEGYLASRKEKGFPLLKEEQVVQAMNSTELFPPYSFVSDARQDCIIEIGSEQLPATFVPIGMRNLEASMRKLLQEKGLVDFHDIHVYGTPQRLTVSIKGLVEGVAAKKIEKKGPPIASAFTQEGSVTPLGNGFLQSIGSPIVTLDSIKNGMAPGLQVQSIKGIDYLFYIKEERALSTIALLSDALPKLILQLEFPKKMRWGQGKISYARPIRWILALFGTEVIPFSVGDICSNRLTRGHAQLSHDAKISLSHPAEYLSALRTHHVLADPKERKESILQQLSALESRLQVKALSIESVLPQVLYLTEQPVLIEATFEESFLRAPQEVLICEMVEHQKYFPTSDNQGKLQNTFFITADNKPSDLIIKGNQKVLSARLSDGVFLYEQDLKIPLEQFNTKLKIMTFQKDLGSMWEKVLRLQQHATVLNEKFSLIDNPTLLRAALLCKSDLASAMVGEFPELQGIIGKYYAQKQGESSLIAEGIEEHWQPKSEHGTLPKTPCGILLSLSDKIDNLLGYFSVGLKPTSSSDPYALKRQTFGLIKILIEEKLSLNIQDILNRCSTHFATVKPDSSIVEEILSFVTNRAKSVFEDYGYKKDEIEASFQGICTNPFLQLCKIDALATFRKGASFLPFYEVYKRVKGFLQEPALETFSLSLCQNPEETKLWETFSLVQQKVQSSLKNFSFLEAFETLSSLQGPLSSFLEAVKIQAEDTALKNNRIALIQEVFHLFEQLLDFSKIQEGDKAYVARS